MSKSLGEKLHDAACTVWTFRKEWNDDCEDSRAEHERVALAFCASLTINEIVDCKAARQEAEKAVMTDRYDELRAAAESLTAGMAGFVRHADFMRASGAYANLANPETVLAILSERDSLLAALKPFADAAGNLDGEDEDPSNNTLLGHSAALTITAGDLRRAATLTTTEG